MNALLLATQKGLGIIEKDEQKEKEKLEKIEKKIQELKKDSQDLEDECMKLIGSLKAAKEKKDILEEEESIMTEEKQ